MPENSFASEGKPFPTVAGNALPFTMVRVNALPVAATGNHSRRARAARQRSIHAISSPQSARAELTLRGMGRRPFGDGVDPVMAKSSPRSTWRRMTSLKLSPGSRVAGIAPHIWRLVTISTYAEALAAIASNSPSSNRSRTMSARSRRSIQGEMALRSLDCNSARPP
jgi:hypothetical protein